MVVVVDPHHLEALQVVLARLQAVVAVPAQHQPLRVQEVTVPPHLLLLKQQVIQQPRTAIMEQLSQHTLLATARPQL